MPHKLTDLLDQIDRLDQEASSAPWFAHPDAKYVYGYDAGAILDRCWDDQPDADIHFAALARTALPALSKAVRAVLELRPMPEDTDARYGYNLALKTAKQTITDALKGDDDD